MELLAFIVGALFVLSWPLSYWERREALGWRRETVRERVYRARRRA